MSRSARSLTEFSRRRDGARPGGAGNRGDRLGTWEVAETTLPPVPGRGCVAEVLLAEAIAAQPELAALREQLRAQELTVRAVEGGYGPSLGVQAGATESGEGPDNLGWGWNTQVTLSWPLFQGGQTRAQVREARANTGALEAQVEQLRQQNPADARAGAARRPRRAGVARGLRGGRRGRTGGAHPRRGAVPDRRRQRPRARRRAGRAHDRPRPAGPGRVPARDGPLAAPARARAPGSGSDPSPGNPATRQNPSRAPSATLNTSVGPSASVLPSQ